MSSNKQTKEKLLILFKKQVISFLDELISSYSQISTFVIIRVFVKDQIPLNDVLGRYIKICLIYKDKVEKRDEDFIINSDAIIEGLGATDWAMDTKKELTNFWLSDQLDTDSKEMIWKWLNLLMSIAQKYYDKFGMVEGWE